MSGVDFTISDLASRVCFYREERYIHSFCVVHHGLIAPSWRVMGIIRGGFSESALDHAEEVFG